MSEASAFTDRDVVITGGRGGLGIAVVAHFTQAGARVHVPPPEVRLDDEASTQDYFASLPGLWASVHLAGGFAAHPILDTTLAELEQQWRMNLVTSVLSCREAVRVLRRAGGGRIVNVAARAAVTGAPNMTAYVTAKAGVVALTQALAAEVLADRILVNAVLPSIIDTPSNRRAMPEADHARWPRPAELARAIAWLASPSNTLTTGALVPVYGTA